MLSAVDKFVLFDNVNFIVRGYINRNSILLNNDVHKFSIPIEKASQNKLIMETKLNFSKNNKEAFLKTITLAYKKAPFYPNCYPILENIILNDEDDLTQYIKYSFDKTNEYLGITTELLLSSKIPTDESLKGKDKIISICKKLGATQYINAIGGQELYSKEDFIKNGIQLNFIKMNDIKYKQFNDKFVPNLSIIDIMMFNSPEEIRKMLDEYTLI